MPKKRAETEPASPTTDSAPADAPPPSLWEKDGAWYHRDETESEYGPFPTKEAAEFSLKECLYELQGFRPPVRPDLEAKMREIWATEAEVRNMEEAFKDAKARLKVMTEHELTELVTDRDLNYGVRFDDGREFTFERKMHCSLPERSKPEGYVYLEGVEAGHLIKRTITLKLGNNSETLARDLAKSIRRLLPQYEVSLRIGKTPSALVEALKQLIKDMGLEIEVEEGRELAGSTLRSFVTKQLHLGKTLPPAFEVYAPMVAVLAAGPSSSPAPAEEESTAS